MFHLSKSSHLNINNKETPAAIISSKKKEEDLVLGGLEGEEIEEGERSEENLKGRSEI